MTIIRRIQRFLLLIAPAMGLIGWFVYEQFPSWTIPTWQTDDPGVCEVNASLKLYNAAPVMFGGAVLTAEQSRAQTAQLVETRYALTADSYRFADGTTLIRATFPGVGERLTWVNLAVLTPPAGDANLGKAAVVYLDAETGNPLALITAGTIADPAQGCDIAPRGRRALVRQYLPLLLAAGYGVIVGVASGIIVSKQKRLATRM